MAAASAHHVVRVTARLSAGAVHRDIDVSLPTASTLAEVLPELSRMIDAPRVDRPWCASTAAGSPLDMHTPLHELRLFDGSLITFYPTEPPAPPVVRDAAESLTAVAASAREVRGLDAAAGLVGAACAGVLASRFAGAPAAPSAAFTVAFTVAALCALALAGAARSPAVFSAVPLAAGGAAGAWVAGPRAEWLSPADPALGVLAASLVAAVTVAAGAWMRLAGPAAVALHLTCALLAAAAAAGAWFPAPSAPAALTILAGLFMVMATPSVATRAAGLAIPRIPTAGEEFAHADGYQADVDERSARAVHIAAAVTAGIAGCLIPAVAVLAFASAPGGWVFALLLSTAGALALHALRQHYPLPSAALTAATLCAVAGCAVIAARPGAHPLWAVIAAGAAALAGTSPLWAPHLFKLEPTTVVWFERAETAAIIAAVPLAVHLTGVFASIRGL